MRRASGYTMIELLVVLSIIAMLLTLAAPRYFSHIEKAKEDVLREDLYLLRDAIDKHYSDKGSYPNELQDLVETKYLRAIPVDPYTGSRTSWVIEEVSDGSPGKIFNVKAPPGEKAADGTPLSEL